MKFELEAELKTEPLFDSVRSVYMIFAAYVKNVKEEFGKDKSMELLTRTFRQVGEMKGRTLKKYGDGTPLNANEAYELMKEIPKSLGINFMVPERNNRKIVVHLDKCPLYESAESMGLDPSEFCKYSGIPYFDAMAKQLNPHLEYSQIKSKSSAEDFCEEELHLTED